jgi:integrase
VRKKPSGNWEIEIRDIRLVGRRISVSARTKSSVEARRREVAIRTAMDRGALDLVERLRATGKERIHVATLQQAIEANDLDSLRAPALGPLTLGDQVERILRTVRATKAPNTLKQYEIVTAMLVAHFGAETPLSAIGSDAIENWLHEPKGTVRSGEPWGPGRQRLSAAIVGRIWNHAIRREAEVADRHGTVPRIRRNPVANVELPKKAAGRAEFLRPREWRVLAERTEGLRVCALLALGCLAGLRLGEAANLRTDIDVVLGDEPVIHVQPREGEFAWRPKTRRSVRTVPVEPELLRILRRHVELRFAGARYFIHSPDADRPMSGQGLRHWVRPAFTAAGIRYGRRKDALTFHSLRHTFISWLVQGDVSLKKIEMVAGTSVRMILDVYGHLMDEDLRRAVAVVDRRAREGA